MLGAPSLRRSCFCRKGGIAQSYTVRYLAADNPGGNLRNLPIIATLLLLPIGAASAQESRTHADFRGEGERFKQSCGEFSFKAVPDCAQVLFTDHPLHIAVGSIAPQNGFGAGAAYVGHYRSE